MNNYNFTDRVRRALTAAREEATRLHHEYVGTEHILLGLLCTQDATALKVLAALTINVDDVRANVAGLIKPGSASGRLTPDLPYTSRGKQVLVESMIEARRLRHEYVGSEHLLLGLLREAKGVGARALVTSGADIERVRAATLQLLGSDLFQNSRTGHVPTTSTSSARLALLLALIALLVGVTALMVAVSNAD